MTTAKFDTFENELCPPFTIVGARKQSTPFVLCSPHSGRVYPASFLNLSQLDPKTLRKSEDCFVDELFLPAARLGAPMISARFPRAFLDVNREPYELDPRLFADPVPDFANAHSTRVAGGLGTLARIVADGDEIYAHPLPIADAFERIEHLYKPFHSALRRLIEKTRQKMGIAVLIDCHSMPSASMSLVRGQRPDVVLGDRFGAACSSIVTAYLRSLFSKRGYCVHVNRPYAGGYITENYGRPDLGTHALQIELNRGLYLDEQTLAKTPNFAALQNDLEQIANQLFQDLPDLLAGPAAAE